MSAALDNDVAAINDFVAEHAQFLVNGKKRRVFGRTKHLQLAIPHQLSHGCLGCGTEWKVTENCLWEKPLLLEKYFKLALPLLDSPVAQHQFVSPTLSPMAFASTCQVA